MPYMFLECYDVSTKYPDNVELIWGLTDQVFITKPNSCTSGDGKELLGDPSMIFEAVCIPQSEHMRINAFSVPFSRVDIGDSIVSGLITFLKCIRFIFLSHGAFFRVRRRCQHFVVFQIMRILKE